MAVSAENLTFSIIEEATLGNTPATPAWLDTAIVSESLIADATFTESEMISGGTRGVKDTVLTQLATSGDVNRELVYEATTDKLIEALLGNPWGNDPHSNTITSNQVYDFTQIISLSIQKKWEIAPATYNYHRYTGQVPASGSFEFAPGEIVQHNTSMVGLSMATGDDEVAGASHVPEAGNPPMTSPRVTSMVLTNAGTETPVSWMNNVCFTNMTVAFENNTRALACIGSLESREIALGRLNITGSGSIYYAADDPIDSMLDEDEYGLLIEVEDIPGNSYKFFFPRCKFTVANVNATGQSTDVMTEFTVQILQDATRLYSVIITKTAAAGGQAAVVPASNDEDD